MSLTKLPGVASATLMAFILLSNAPSLKAQSQDQPADAAEAQQTQSEGLGESKTASTLKPVIHRNNHV